MSSDKWGSCCGGQRIEYPVGKIAESVLLNLMDRGPVKAFYSMPRLAELLVAAGEPKAALLHHLYGPKNYETDRFSQRVDGLANYLVENAELVTATLPHLHADGQERLMRDLGRLKIGIGVFFEILFLSGVGTSKNVRKAARNPAGSPGRRILEQSRADVRVR